MKKSFDRNKIILLRKQNNLSQSQFAEKLGITYKKQHISGWELGKKSPNIKSLADMANAFNMTMDYFFA